ncbi:MAG: hypothetical protein RLZ26_386 [Pseudomonadota bacterium]|jgi:hypothetical protein
MDSLHDSVPDIAVHGEGGIDVFRRKAGAEAATGRFDCLCTLVPLPQGGHRMIAHSGTARHAREAIELARDRLAATPWLGQVFALGRTAGYLSLASGAPVADRLMLVLYLDFLRAWHLADLAIGGFEAGLGRRETVSVRQARHVLQLLVNFNRPRRARSLVVALMPRLIGAPRDESAGDAAAALRLAGELCLRRGDARLALVAHEGALRFGETRARLMRARAAAQAAGDTAAEARLAARIEQDSAPRRGAGVA